MQNTTIALIEILKLPAKERDSSIIRSLVRATLSCGGKSDSDQILLQFISNSQDFDHAFLLPILKKFGDQNDAEQLFNHCITDERLRENEHPEVLEVLAVLKFKQVKPILINYAFEIIETNYFLSESAILGLLNFKCNDIEIQIERAIKQCYEKNLFSEFIPALVCKLKNKGSALEKLYELGTAYASSNCNAGILLGFSLSGPEGKAYFKKALFNPNWELDDATGATYFACLGMHNLNITFKELYHEVRNLEEGKDYALRVLLTLLERRIKGDDIGFKETLRDLYRELFRWKNESESDNLIDISKQRDNRERASRLERLIEMKIDEEVLLMNTTNQYL